MKPTIDPFPVIYEKPLYFDYIVEGIKHLVSLQNTDGSWGEENLTTFQKIYYTTQVIQCLLKAGFPLTSYVIQDALAYLDNFIEPSIENRAKFFLYLPLDKLSEDELRNYLELLKRIQRENGSFFYEILDLKGKEVTMDEWPGVRRGSFMFYIMHVLHFLSMIDDAKYKNLTSLKNKIWNKAWQTLLTQLKGGAPPYTLKDPTTKLSDPELSSYALGLLHKKGYQVPNFSEVIMWLLNKQVKGSWLNSCKVTSFVIIDLSTLSFDIKLSQRVKDAIVDAMRWLINQKKHWEKSPNLTALVINALISGNIFLNPDFQEAFFINYTEVLRREIKEKEKQIHKVERKTKIQNILSFILGIAIPLVVEHLIIPH